MSPAEAGAPAGAQRLDKWLWFARVARTRSLAARLIEAGKIKINRARVDKPSQLVKPGDVITSTVVRTVRVLRVLAPGERRGPAAEAALLYEDLTPPPVTVSRLAPGGLGAAQARDGARAAGAGRPTKRDRRQIEEWKDRGS